MNQSSQTVPDTMASPSPDPASMNPAMVLLEILIPGFSLFSKFVARYTGIDLQIYIPALLVLGLVVLSYRYISRWFWRILTEHLMSTADIRIDDEIYNMLMAWIVGQSFAQSSRNFVANMDLKTQTWQFMHRGGSDSDDDEDAEEEKTRKSIKYTPSFGTHWFWYKGYPMMFSRREQNDHLSCGRKVWSWTSWSTMDSLHCESLSAFLYRCSRFGYQAETYR